MRILPLSRVNGLLGGLMSGRGQGNFLSIGWENILEGLNHKAANGMKMWKES
jgi:hypothetical protein